MFKKKNKFEGFDRESRPRIFSTMLPRSDFLLFCRMKHYGWLLHIME